MQVQALKDENGDFLLSFDDTMVTLDKNDLKKLLIEIIQAYASSGTTAKFSPIDLFNRLKEADDVSIQTLLQTVEQEDIVALVNAIFNPSSLPDTCAADLNQDGTLNVQDIVSLVAIILSI